MKVKQIDIGGKERPFKFGINASYKIADILKCEASEVDKLIFSFADKKKKGEDATIEDLRNMAAFMFGGLWSGARRVNEEFKYSFEDVADWIDEDPKAFLEAVISLGEDDVTTKKKEQENPSPSLSDTANNSPKEQDSTTTIT